MIQSTVTKTLELEMEVGKFEMHFGNITKSNELRKITNLKFTIAIKSTQHQHLGFVDIDTGIFNNKKIFGVLCPVMPPSNKRHTEESNRELLR